MNINISVVWHSKNVTLIMIYSRVVMQRRREGERIEEGQIADQNIILLA